MIAYKVVRAERSWMTSAVIVNPVLELTYRIGETTVPEISGSQIFVFTTLSAAHEFAKYLTGVKILECETGEWFQIKYMLRVSATLGVQDIQEYWRAGSAFGETPPAGTVGVNWCKPIRVVEL